MSLKCALIFSAMLLPTNSWAQFWRSSRRDGGPQLIWSSCSLRSAPTSLCLRCATANVHCPAVMKPCATALLVSPSPTDSHIIPQHMATPALRLHSKRAIIAHTVVVAGGATCLPCLLLLTQWSSADVDSGWGSGCECPDGRRSVRSKHDYSCRCHPVHCCWRPQGNLHVRHLTRKWPRWHLAHNCCIDPPRHAVCLGH